MTCSSRDTSLSKSTSAGTQLAFFRIENPTRRASGVLKYASRLSDLPAPGKFSNSPRAIASVMRLSAIRLKGT